MQRTLISFKTDDSSHRRPVGLTGHADFEGITSIGLTFMDPACRPRTGGFVTPEIEEQKVVVVEKIVEDDGGLIAGVVIMVILLIAAIAVAVYFYICCIRRNNKKIEILEIQKADWEASTSKRNQQPIVFNMQDDDYDLRNKADDSARVGLKAGEKRYENDDVETIEV